MRIIRFFVKNIFRIYFFLFYKIDIIGKENLPKEGGYLLCSNHIHWMDPVLYVAITKRMIYAMGKEELFKNKLISFIMHRLGVFPVKRNSADSDSIDKSINYLKDEQLLILYPEGTRYGLEKGIKPKKGAALIAIKAQKPIIPMAMVGSFKPFSTVRLKIGKPIDLSNYYQEENEKINPRNLITVTNDLMAEIVNMRDELYSGLSDRDKELIQAEIARTKEKYLKEVEAKKLLSETEKV